MKANEVLLQIQKELDVPKTLYNSFAKYHYRSAECILNAAKPLLSAHNCTLTLSDELVYLGERYYIKSTAKLCIGDECIESHGYAREDENKKGMDSMQLTGATSSYARKYALNGLFCIDDVKDSDYTNKGGSKEAPKGEYKGEPKGYKNDIETWLPEDAFKIALKMSDVTELKTFIQEWSKTPKGMKKDYRAQLIELGKSLSNN